MSTMQELLASAQQEGVLSPGSIHALTVVDIGEQIQNALGTPADEVTASEVTLVTMLIDDSGSIRFRGNSQAVRDGHNAVLEALRGSKSRDAVLAHTRYLNGNVLFPYVPLAEAAAMDSHNFNPEGGTPLYDETIVVLGTVLVKFQELSVQAGVPARTVTLIVTDGHDEHSPRHMGGRGTTPAACASLVSDMLRSEQHIIAAMGIDDGATDFRQVFREMGIRDEWMITPGNSASEIRHAFAVFSRSSVRASQGAESFSQTALGGFGA